ncbi:MAG TPA: prepilin-type N-terminal cleavage/methylation domain-containing protein [Brevundimonas sp.]|uniref:prepilin-type N-terminal cleavage/methylation domain-containing protein n=1 Tax=Brevundimonas sp. TaxID=1871086 RepID=UPI0026271B70|nr:prepilin-type N-terminal cleavage/methylation domain-containing protein [Brevundimonas sp.]HRO32482.1 prepilin-type N-terminal cleavage/methylation domain-containing protein [Brevundimonas sp.]
MTRPPRAGFSLIEALVVLAVGGLALTVIFSIGMRAGDAGFRLGRGAMAAADRDVALGDIRATVRSIALRPTSAFLPQIDRPMDGQAQRMEVEVVMERATQCAPQGWSGRLVLEIADQDGERVLTCRAGNRPVTRLMTLTQGQTGFSYSTDGQVWTPAYANTPAPRGDGPVPPLNLWVRLAGPGVDIVEMASSGRAEIWYRVGADGAL